MLWYKTWLETRWRFLIGLVLLVCSAAGAVIIYPRIIELMPLADDVKATGRLGREIKEAAELARTYRGYIWSSWITHNMTQMWTLFAVLLGTGGLLAQTSGGAALFTLSMPVSRRRIVGVRAATGALQLLVLAIVPSLVIPIFSPAVGQTYGFGDAVVHAVCMFVAGGVFFSLAFLLSTVFGDLWRPLLGALAVAGVLALAGQIFEGFSAYNIYGVMTGESYFRTGDLPWIGLLATAAISAAMLYTAAINTERRDF